MPRYLLTSPWLLAMLRGFWRMESTNLRASTSRLMTRTRTCQERVEPQGFCDGSEHLTTTHRHRTRDEHASFSSPYKCSADNNSPTGATSALAMKREDRHGTTCRIRGETWSQQ